MVPSTFARRLWRTIEPLHPVTYFADEARQANVDLGFRNFWMGYFASRAAPMGTVRPAVVVATFYNFAPAMVHEVIPDAWAYADPEFIIVARAKAAAAALRRIHPEIESSTDRLAVEPLAVLDGTGVLRGLSLLAPVSTAIVDAGAVPFPNPMGLPRTDP
jgi:hypothetical protein